jgi:protein-tyrosine-phosphatase
MEATRAHEAEAEQGASSPNNSASPTVTPQLIRRADLVLQLDDPSSVLGEIEQILQQRQGDLLDLRDQRSGQTVPEVKLRLRVPQTELDATVTALSELGTVQSRSITAEDVSRQQVDLGARQRNLHRSETALLDLMEQTGSIPEVLEVARELSRTRESIEQISAQLSQLNDQITYSTISVTLVATSATTTALPVPQQLRSTWRTATQSVGQVSLSLVKLGLWLMAYSPYWVLALGLGWGVRRWLAARTTAQPPTPQQES